MNHFTNKQQIQTTANSLAIKNNKVEKPESNLGNSVATISRSEVPIRDGEEETFDFLKWMKGGR